MKAVIAFLGLYILIIAGPARAQLNPDSVVRSISPITWNILFDNLDSVWSGSLQLDSAEVSNDSIYIVLPYSYWRISFTLDTVDRRISLNLTEFETGQFRVSQVPYTLVGSKILAAVYCTDAGNIPDPPGSLDYCKGGWVTIGGASPPATVREPPLTSAPSFISRRLSDYTTQFFFPPNSDRIPIRIFDLLGRLRDEIRLQPQTTSIEYANNRLAPGMYVATLGGNAIKFVVP